MKIPAFTLFERTLRLETRSALMCWSRAGLLIIILLVMFPIQSLARAGFYGAPGREFLESIAFVNLFVISLAGLSYFASAITEEKEEMMLGLLRMTGLNAVSILLGKSTSRLIGAFLLLVVQIPFVLLAVTLGGVALVQVVAAYTTLLAYLFLLCNVALLLSVVFRNTATAGGVILFIILLFLFGHYLASGIEQSIAVYHRINLQRGIWPILTKTIDFWREASPLVRLETIFLTGFKGPVIGLQVVSNLVAGILFFLLSWVVFDWCTREEKDASPVRLRLWRRTSRRSRIPRHLVGFQAITWKDFTFISGGKFGLLLKFLVMGLLVAFCNVMELLSGDRITREFEGPVLIWVSLLSTAVWLAVEASRVFKDEVRWKTLSSLMILPISVPHLAYRKLAGGLAGTLPLLAVFVAGVLLIPDKFGEFLNDISKEPSAFWGLVVTVLQYILFLHLTAFLSLVIKRGALPLAIAIHFLGGGLFLGFLEALTAFSGGPGAMLFVIGFLCVMLTIPLHFGIGFRLERAGAEE